MIPLIKDTFINEENTKRELANFILSSKKLSMGEECREFEKKFTKFQDRKHAILFNSGGSANLALLQSLKNLGHLKDNARIGFSALTWSTNVMPIIQLGMIPIALDCDPESLNVMSKNILETIKEVDLDAIFITNVLGFTGDLEKIKDICAKRNIILMEDNCEALGTIVSGEKSGNYGIGASFSFFVAHHMSTIEGGMICTNNDELAEMLKIVRANGWDRNLNNAQQEKLREKHNVKSEFEAKYTFYDLGYNLRPTEITGFLGLNQLKYLKDNIKTRNKNHLFLASEIMTNPDLIYVQHSHLDFLSPFAFPVVCKTNELKKLYSERFEVSGIEIRPMIAGNIQNQPFYKKYVKNNLTCKGADFLTQNSFYCGNYPGFTENDLETIKKCLKQIK